MHSEHIFEFAARCYSGSSLGEACARARARAKDRDRTNILFYVSFVIETHYSRRDVLAKNSCQRFELSLIIREKRCLSLSLSLYSSLLLLPPFVLSVAFEGARERGDVPTKIAYARSPRVTASFFSLSKTGRTNGLFIRARPPYFLLSLFPSRNEGFLDNRLVRNTRRERERERERGGREKEHVAKLRATNATGKISFFASGFITSG